MSQTFPLAGVPALVLGAGFGTRLRPLTLHIPKPAIPLLGRPLIAHPLLHLFAGGCTEAWVNAHHHPERLRAHLLPWVQRRLPGLRLRWSIERPEILGTGGALRLLGDSLCGSGGPVLLLNGDSVQGMDMAGLLRAHLAFRAQGTRATLLCLPRADAERFGAVRVDGEGRILDLAGLARRPGSGDEEIAAARACVFCGVQVLEPDVVRSLPPAGTPSCIVRQGYAPLLRDGADLRAVMPAEGTPFFDVGTPGRYLEAQAGLLADGGERVMAVAPGIDPRGALLQEASFAIDRAGREHGDPDSVAGLAGAVLEPPVYFGPGNRVEPGARIGPCASLGAGNVVGAGALVRDAAIWDGVEAGPRERFVGVIAANLCGRTLRAAAET